jgi:proline iminopeptidase
MKSGYLDVGNGHKIYYEDWGNPKATPILYLHGGPGGNFSDETKLLFNEEKHRVIFHDQRGCGRSTPYAQTNHNTTQDLIEDIEKLTKYLNIDIFFVMGGSWGSSLSLLYTIAHPEKVIRLLLWGIYLVRQFETDYVNEGYPKFNFPGAWDRFISLVPESDRKNGDSIMSYYAKNIRSKDQATAKKFADEWTLWESTLMSINYNQKKLEVEVLNEENTAIAILETHYFMNKCFIPENYILNNIKKINHIPCYVVQGIFDFCTPAIGAYDMAKAYGQNLTLQWTRSGHSVRDPENSVAIKTFVATSFV